MAGLPIVLEVEGRPCLVVGGGPVAERKVEALLGVDARVTVVSPTLTRRLQAWVEARSVRHAADDPARCDFTLPSVLRRGELTVAVSTGGTSPALARTIREELERYFTDDYRVLADVAAQTRRELRRDGRAPDAETWRRALKTLLAER